MFSLHFQRSKEHALLRLLAPFATAVLPLKFVSIDISYFLIGVSLEEQTVELVEYIPQQLVLDDTCGSNYDIDFPLVLYTT